MTDAADPPLRVDWIDVELLADGRPGRLGLTFLPGKHGPSLRYPGRVYRRELETDLASLAAAGVTGLVLLVDDDELDRWGDPAIVERGLARGITVERRPIPDMQAPPSPAAMDSILSWIAAARSRGDVAVACMGGVGRTGTVAACAIVETGRTADEAIGHLRRIRHPTAVETDAQVAFVHAYARRHGPA